MIVLYKGETASIALTLTEDMVIATNSFLFEFRQESTNKYYYFTSPDLSTNDRSNLFLMGDSTIEDSFNGIMNFNPGLYQYKVFENEDPLNLTYSALMNELETGIAYVIGTMSFDALNPTNSIYL